MSKFLLILDLDETLIHATEAPLDQPHDFRVGSYVVYKRPHLDRFLAFCTSNFEPAVWTTATEPYAMEVVEHLFPDPDVLSFVWTRSRCTRRFDRESRADFWIKDLKKVKRLGYALEKVIVVDDQSAGLARHYGNIVHVLPFRGARDDQELSLLIPYLEHLKGVEDIRRVEKRFWRKGT